MTMGSRDLVAASSCPALVLPQHCRVGRQVGLHGAAPSVRTRWKAWGGLGVTEQCTVGPLFEDCQLGHFR